MKERKLIDETTRNCWQVLIKGALKSVLILNYEIDDISQRVWAPVAFPGRFLWTNLFYSPFSRISIHSKSTIP